MKEKKEISNIFIMNKYTVAYIYISSILAYFIFNFFVNNQLIIPLIFRIYYIILSAVLFVLLKQVRKFYKQYISKIVVIFFLLMIFISAVGFIISINGRNLISQFTMIYIETSRESLLLIEIFCSYVLSEYFLENRELKKASYVVVFIIIASILLIYFFDGIVPLIRIIYLIIEVPLFTKTILNIKGTIILKSPKSSILMIYLCSLLIIFIANIYRFYNYDNELINILSEIMHLINFRMVWNLIVIKLIRDPYKTLSSSLNEKNKELDKLNEKISVGNIRLQKSINLIKSKEYLYSTLFRFMPHPIIIVNSNNDRILFVNKQFLELAGISNARNIINKKVNKYIEFMTSDIECKNYNAILYMGDKRKYIEAKLLSNYSDTTKKLILIKDKTPKVQIEEIRKEVENKKIEETIRAEFLSSISHDLKTPINVIYSAMQVEKIYIQKEDLEVLNKYNNISKQNCISLIKLTNNLIDNSKINSDYLVARLENINVVEVIEDNVMSLIDYVKWNNIDLIFDTNTEECYLKIDNEFMDRIILNLVSNAVKFTPAGGEIYVIIHADNEKVNIYIKDNGSGIEQEFIDKAFNRYSVGENCTNDYRSGAGIGLCVVKQLVELQRGSIEIKRNEDAGTTISIEFKKGE